MEVEVVAPAFTRQSERPAHRAGLSLFAIGTKVQARSAEVERENDRDRRRQKPMKTLRLLAGAALATLVVAATATATSNHSRGLEQAAAPFAQSWAEVPRTSEARKAKDVLVFGQEQDIVGFNV